MSEMDEALKAFLAESREGLEQLEIDLVELEREPGNATRLAAIFRIVHTIKGTCGFFGLNRLEQLTHAAEDVLAQLRDGKISYGFELTAALFELIDAVRAMLVLVEQTGNEGSEDFEPLAARFRALLRTGTAPAEAPAAAAPASVATDDHDRQANLAETAIRVDVDLLDKLMNVVGELVLTRNQILQHVNAQADGALLRISQRLNHITTELQEGVMKTRMQPISTLWNTYPRLMRDLELHTGKQLQLLREGGDTELDRTILQAIKDPLVHILRNAVDHGLEAPDARKAVGKSAVGLIKLRALHESGYVIIEISDDGAGIDTAKVLEKAIARGLLKAEQASMLGERDILELLFQPGFSTAAEITSISGRGVGLDVVRSNVARVGGTVDIQSWPGRGTTFRVKIPLTLAIIPAVVITCHHERYAVPQVNIREIVQLEGHEVARRIEAVHDTRVYRLRGKLLPLVDLRELLRLPPRSSGESVFILVLQSDGREFGLVVDSVRDTEEIVVKPLGRHLKGTRCYAGATIMGDGRVALILDALAIAQQTKVVGESQMAQRAMKQSAAAAAEMSRDEQVSLLLIRVGSDGTAAIPLSWVQRLEEFPVKQIEKAARGEMIQYRDRILPLVRLSHLLDLPTNIERSDNVHVVVHEEAEGPLGLVVDHIIDIVEESAGALAKGGESLTGGLAVVQGRVTEMFDTHTLTRLSRDSLRRTGSSAERKLATETHHEQ
ncbi:MAG TPA: chemotaxis protein CheW [Moraxellaceae bacterium]|nr:chemotaxis protein CheW [Moraxellaceae bacterium]